MSNVEVHPQPSELIVSILQEHLAAPVEHLRQGALPEVPSAPTVRVRPLLAPAPRYSRVGGFHKCTVQIQSVNPINSDSLLDHLPVVNRGAQLAGRAGVIISMRLQPKSRSIVAGVLVHQARAEVLVAERAPAVQGIPFDARLRAEAKRLTARTGASGVADFEHGSSVGSTGIVTTTLSGSFTFPKGSTSPGAAHKQVRHALEGQAGWNIEAVGNVAKVEVQRAVVEDVRADREAVVAVPFTVAYRARTEVADVAVPA